MQTRGFIYDTESGSCLGRVLVNGELFNSQDGKKIGTVDDARNVFDLEDNLIGHLEETTQVGRKAHPCENVR